MGDINLLDVETPLGVGIEGLDLKVSGQGRMQDLGFWTRDGLSKAMMIGKKRLLTSPETVTGPPSDSWVKVMTPVTEESPLRTATA